MVIYFEICFLQISHSFIMQRKDNFVELKNAIFLQGRKMKIITVSQKKKLNLFMIHII
jgi:hypothetical protein